MCKQMPSCFSFSQKPQWYFLYQKSLHGTKKGEEKPKLVSLFELESLRKIQLIIAAENPFSECKKVIENVFTSVLSSDSLKLIGDRKSQKSTGIALIQSWPVTRFSPSSSHADSSMQKCWVNLKFSTIRDIYFGFGSSFLFWVFTKQCLPRC